MPFTSISNFSLQSANYTLLGSDDVVQFNCSSGSLTATLLSASLVPVGKRYEIRRSADATPANALTINTTSAQTIDGRASASVILSPSDYLVVVSDGSNWQVVTLQETVASRYTTANAQVFSNGTATVITTWTKDYDTHSGMNASTGVYTVKVAGRYRVMGKNSVDFNASAQYNVQFDIRKNGSPFTQVNTSGTLGAAQPSTLVAVPVTDTEYFAAGDTIDLRYFQASGNNRTQNATAILNTFTIEKIGN